MKRGFTLVELLGVIVILGVIAVIITPVVSGTIAESKEKAYKKQINIIETSAKEWAVEHDDRVPDDNSTNRSIVTIQDLLDAGKLQNTEIINPKDNSVMNGCVVITNNSEYNQYEYKYTTNSDECYICKASTTLTTSNVGFLASDGNPYIPGVEYKCNLGDIAAAKNLVFYVLEVNGDKVSLIENNDIAVTPWLSDADAGTSAYIDIRKYGPITANKALKNATSSWTMVNQNQISLPTYNQLYNAGGPSAPTWLRVNLAASPSLYWTAPASGERSVWIVTSDYNFVNSTESFTSSSGEIRPVITIPKNLIK